MSSFRTLFVFCALFCLLVVNAQAQTPAIGAIRGQVLDPAGAPIAGAEVTITNEATGFTRTVRTDARGLYTLPELPLTGTYRIQAAREGVSQLRLAQTADVYADIRPDVCSHFRADGGAHQEVSQASSPSQASPSPLPRPRTHPRSRKDGSL